MFFSFEGIDGSGKTTQAKLLARSLREREYEVVEVREPGGTPLGESIRSLLLDSTSDVGDRAELLLFSAARAQLVRDIIAPALGRGAVVIADRFYDSTTAYQGGGREVAPTEIIEVINHFSSDGTVPDRTYLVDVPVELAARRREATKADRMEASDSRFFHAVRSSYNDLASLNRFVTIDGRQSVQKAHAEIYRDALRVMG